MGIRTKAVKVVLQIALVAISFVAGMLMFGGEGFVASGPKQATMPANIIEPSLDVFNWKWEYAEDRIDLSYGAIFGNRKMFEDWRAKTRSFFKSRMDEVIVPPVTLSKAETRVRKSYDIHSYTSPSGDVLLAIPHYIDPKKPVVIALHGHEIPPRGELPWELFNIWAGRFAQDGYVVLAPSHLWYDRVGGKKHAEGSKTAEWDEKWHQEIGPVDYPIEWAKRVDVLLDGTAVFLPNHTGLAIVGLSAGGLTASTLMAARNDICAGVFAGSFTNLNFNREHYRIRGHPFNWDIRWLNSLTALHALLAPRPVQWQLGELDGFWPSTKKPVGDAAPNLPRFPGFSRYTSSGEVWGEFLILERLYAKFGAAPKFHIHSGGHEVDYPAAEQFLRQAHNCHTKKVSHQTTDGKN